MTVQVVITTGGQRPAITNSDALLRAELERRGHLVDVVPWNDAPIDRFWAADLVVLRSNWDYWTDLAGFEQWLGAVEASPAELVNPAPLVRWNLRKDYLADLARAGAPVPETGFFELADPEPLHRWLEGRDRAVIKPVVGCSGHGVELVERGRIDDAIERLASLGPDTGVLAQEYIEGVDAGELALVFFGGRYSHAFRRVPPPGEFRVNSQFGGVVEAAEPDRRSLEVADATLAALPSVPVYARVDLVTTEAGPVVMEVELNEPSLCLDHDEFAPVRFADALVGRDRD